MGYDQNCPKYEQAIEVLGKRWTGLIVRILLGGPWRFRDIRERIPELSDRVLSDRLQELEDAGIVLRMVRTCKPVLIEYGLTDKGRELEPVVGSIQTWAERWFTVEPVPPATDPEKG